MKKQFFKTENIIFITTNIILFHVPVLVFPHNSVLFYIILGFLICSVFSSLWICIQNRLKHQTLLKKRQLENKELELKERKQNIQHQEQINKIECEALNSLLKTNPSQALAHIRRRYQQPDYTVIDINESENTTYLEELK